MKFKYGQWVKINRGFYQGSPGHIVGHRNASLGLGASADLYQVLLDVPQTAIREQFLQQASPITLEVQESEVEYIGFSA